LVTLRREVRLPQKISAILSDKGSKRWWLPFALGDSIKETFGDLLGRGLPLQIGLPVIGCRSEREPLGG